MVANASEPLTLETHRDRFHERALRDVTTNSSDATMMLDPSNPLLITEEMDGQKVSLTLGIVVVGDAEDQPRIECRGPQADDPHKVAADQSGILSSAEIHIS